MNDKFKEVLDFFNYKTENAHEIQQEICTNGEYYQAVGDALRTNGMRDYVAIENIDGKKNKIVKQFGKCIAPVMKIVAIYPISLLEQMPKEIDFDDYILSSYDTTIKEVEKLSKSKKKKLVIIEVIRRMKENSLNLK